MTMAVGGQHSTGQRAGGRADYCPVARRDAIGPLEAAAIQRWRERFGWTARGGGWQATCAYAGRGEHEVRMACDADYARRHGKAPLASGGASDGGRRPYVSPPPAAASAMASPVAARRARRSTLRTALLLALAGGVELSTTDLADEVERLSPSCTCQLLTLERKGLVLARRGAKRTHIVHWRLSPAGEREAAVLKGVAQPWPSVMAAIRAVKAGHVTAEAVGGALGMTAGRASNLLWRGADGGWIDVTAGRRGVVQTYALTDLGCAAMAARDAGGEA